MDLLDIADNWLSKGDGPVHECGLFISDSQNKVVPLKSRHVEVQLQADTYITECHETFTYIADENANVRFKFPLPPKSAVYRFSAKIGDKVIKTKTKRKSEAVADFSAATSQGHTAAIAKQSVADLFEIELGNLEAFTECVVELQYVKLLDILGSSLEFVHTATWVPPYISASHDKAEALEVSPKFHDKVGYCLSYDLQLHGAQRIQNVTSFSHEKEIRVTKGDGSWRVRLSSEVSDAGKDFQVLLELDEQRVPDNEVVLQHTEQEGDATYLLAKFTPRMAVESPVDSVSVKKELVLLIDCSGSMGGQPIKAAKQAALYFVRDLPVGQGLKFNVVVFESKYKVLFPGGAQAYGSTTESDAVHWINDKVSARGGTEIFEPLAAIYGMPLETGYKREIIILTDGGVYSKEAEAMYNLVSGDSSIPSVGSYTHNNGAAPWDPERLKSTAALARVSCLGIGHGVHRDLIEGLSSRTGGCTAYVMGDENITSKTGHLKKLALAPRLWHKPQLITHNCILRMPSPAIKYALLDGEPFLVVAEVLSCEEDAALELKAVGDKDTETLSLKVPLDQSDTRQGEALRVLHAMSYVSALLSGLSSLHISADGSKQTQQPAQDTVTEEVVRVSCAAGLVTPFTATVGLLIQQTPLNPSETVSHEVPLQVPHGRTLWNNPKPKPNYFASRSGLGMRGMRAPRASPSLMGGASPSLMGSAPAEQQQQMELQAQCESVEMSVPQQGRRSSSSRYAAGMVMFERVKQAMKCKSATRTSSCSPSAMVPQGTVSNFCAPEAAAELSKDQETVSKTAGDTAIPPKAAAELFGDQETVSETAGDTVSAIPPDVQSRVEQLNMMRSTEGYWPCRSDVLALVFTPLAEGPGDELRVPGMTQEQLDAKLSEVKGALDVEIEEGDVLVTVLVVAWLRKKGMSQQQIWEGMEKKAMKWLQGKWRTDSAVGITAVIMKAKAVL